MSWFHRQLGRLRLLDPLLADGVLAAFLFVASMASIWASDIGPGYEEPGAATLLTTAAATLPLVVRRRYPLEAVVVCSVAILVHITMNWPEGALPIGAALVTYAVAAWDRPRRAVVGLGVVYLTLIALWAVDTAGLDTLGVIGNIASFTVAWVGGVAVRARRETVEARISEAERRAEVARQSAARMLAEERLRIAQELHDVVAHSMSVIAVQAGVGSHLADRPEAARSALEAISATSRGTLVELRRLLGVLRDEDGERSHAPAPGLGDVDALVADVRDAGVPVELEVTGSPAEAGAGIELSAFRIVQEALTNVIKHAGPTSRVGVTVAHAPGSVTVEVVDDGRGSATAAAYTSEGAGGHGLLGMRERVELWGGELTVGPEPGGGYRVRACLPVGEGS